ncbi:MAG: hypothetical protein CVV23_15110 [Ignavibacteriae bacterium HGW-Ignavibacteriae-2]|jgi:uncharacterized protein Smg (DUF494 family)|nr:DUF494 domain-containing protein [Bacteroidota bacterium]PKL87489.1 MAG: hypothetical protein CVV23_15110 [Ignavibacteriae bacterium HGW-Ignavibacteriae-2]
MTAKIVEVLARILDGINKNIPLEEVNKQLLKNKEFDKQILSAAFSLVYDKVLSGKILKDKVEERPKKIRLLTDEERDFVGLDNYNYILQLVNIGLIDSLDVEIILEQLMLFPEDTINRDDINWIILISLVDFNSKILPGSRILLYSSDTIN